MCAKMKTQGKIEIQQVAMAPPGAAKMLNLKWDNRDRIVNTKSFEFYLGNDFTDCLLSAEGNYLACHQIVLATSSPYFDVSLINLNKVSYGICMNSILEHFPVKTLRSEPGAHLQ